MNAHKNITLDIEVIKKYKNKCYIKDIELPKIRLFSEFLVPHSHTSWMTASRDKCSCFD